MGYNTWDDFRCGGINASNLMKVADAMVAQQLPELGYRYVSMDDCWAKSRDPTTGVIRPDPKAFPDGMKAVADYVHSKGLLFGVYTDRGEHTCVGRPGSQGYEALDAKT
jgi:alpha-galactosidase